MIIKPGETIYMAIYRPIHKSFKEWYIAGYNGHPHYHEDPDVVLTAAKRDHETKDVEVDKFEYKAVSFTAPE